MEWETLSTYFDVPWSKLEEIQEEHSNVTKRKQAMLEEWLNHHPAPSWMLVANALFRALYHGGGYFGYGKYHTELQLVKKKYLKGRKYPPTRPIE